MASLSDRVTVLEQELERLMEYVGLNHRELVEDDKDKEDIAADDDEVEEIVRYVICCDPKPIKGNKGPRLYWGGEQVGSKNGWSDNVSDADIYATHGEALHRHGDVGKPPKKYGKPKVTQVWV